MLFPAAIRAAEVYAMAPDGTTCCCMATSSLNAVAQRSPSDFVARSVPSPCTWPPVPKVDSSMS